MDDREIKAAIASSVRETLQLGRHRGPGQQNAETQRTAREYAEQLILPAVERMVAQARAEGYRAGVGGRAEPVS